MRSIILTIAIVAAAIALAMSANPADARGPDPDGCYRANWPWPFLDVPSTYCPVGAREANADGPSPFRADPTPPPRDPPDHCPPKGYE